jgi:YesN/AraC family two-component response regulator
MRRSQPRARTFILTGYPDFASALTAIRNQVDDYFTKPADIEKLIETFNQPATEKRPERSVPLKSISAIIRENQEQIIERWLTHCRSNPELSRAAASQHGRVDHLPRLLLEIADRIENHPEKPSRVAVAAAADHGILRHEQGYTIPMLLVEASILQKTIAGLLQERLLSIDVSTLIPDMQQMSEAVNCAVETSVRAYLELDPAPRVA